MTETIFISAAALVIEALFGYPRWLFGAVGHPVTWMGALISWLDPRLNRERAAIRSRRFWGFATVACLLTVSDLFGFVVARVSIAALGSAAIFVVGMLASTCIAQRSLDAHVRAVADALERKTVDEARRAVGQIVGRATSNLDEAGISRAAIESLAENFADGVVAPAFWIAVLGLPGGLMYKAINTADSMIGHRTPRHAAFGFAAAKLDDIINWLPARLAALWLIVASLVVREASPEAAWRVMRRDAHGHPSPNAGWPEAAMAGALGVRLGGPRVYADRAVEDSFIGDDQRPADARAIRAALRLYRAACALQIAAVGATALVIAQWR